MWSILLIFLLQYQILAFYYPFTSQFMRRMGEIDSRSLSEWKLAERLQSGTTQKDEKLSSAISGISSGKLKQITDFCDAYRQALNSNQSLLKNILLRDIKYTSPLANSCEEQLQALKSFSDFFLDPGFIIFGVHQPSTSSIVVSYQLSFYYPTPWRPRIIIPGKFHLICTNKDIESIREEWEVSITDIFFKQFPPRFWDLWYVFSSPSPEYPPIKQFGSSSSNAGKLSFSEYPPTVMLETSWSNTANFPGPPLLIVPGFALWGKLKTSKPNRDPYYATLPVEVRSMKYKKRGSDQKQEKGGKVEKESIIKQTTWALAVPSVLQSKIWEHAKNREVFPIPQECRLAQTDDKDANTEADYIAKIDNFSVMKGSTMGFQRGDFDYDIETMKAFEENEYREYRYRIQSARRIISTDIKGDVSPQKIDEALKLIRASIATGEAQAVFKSEKPLRVKEETPWGRLKEDAIEGDKSEALGFQLWNTKSCFNSQAEPSIAVYEMQYNNEVTKIFLEVEEDI
jgi:hypothetical protein